MLLASDLLSVDLDNYLFQCIGAIPDNQNPFIYSTWDQDDAIIAVENDTDVFECADLCDERSECLGMIVSQESAKSPVRCQLMRDLGVCEETSLASASYAKQEFEFDVSEAPLFINGFQLVFRGEYFHY